MEPTRLSDTDPSALQICGSCRRALRLRQIPKIGGINRSKLTLSSCPLCILVTNTRREWEKNYFASCSFVRNIYLTTQPKQLEKKWIAYTKAYEESWCDPHLIDDLNDLIFYSSSTKPLSTNFGRLVEDTTATSSGNPWKLIRDDVVRAVPRGEIDTTMVQSWLKRCNKHHERCDDLRLRFIDTKHYGPQWEIILIDVRNKKLIKRNSKCRYLALSYVWGGTPQLQLTSSNLEELQTHMSLRKHWDKIPRVIQDAIDFTAAIGEYCLWVDTLCIAQDSENRHEDITRMNEIYSGAKCTLVALCSKDATNPLAGFRPGTRKIKPIAKCHDLLIAKRSPDLSKIFSMSSYETRAWTFQERLLSSRCLFFTNEQLFFHCPSELWSEDRYEHFKQTADFFGNLVSLEPSKSTSGVSRSFRDGSAGKFLAYAELVTQYSSRVLTYNYDILNAFSGVLNAKGKEWDWDFLQGIPLQSFYLALLWDCSELDQDRIYKHHSGEKLPSWSWAGWSGAKYYALAESVGELSNFVIGPMEVTPNEGAMEDTRRLRFDRHIDRAERLSSSDRLHMSNIPGLSLASLQPDVLFFWAEEVSCRRFNFLLTHIDPGRLIPGRKDRRVMRILNHQHGSCGVLLHSGNSPPGYLKTWNFQFLAANFKLIRLAHSRPVTRWLDDAIVEQDDSYVVADQNVFEKAYRPSLEVYTVMLISWTDEGYAQRVAMGQIHPRAWEEAEPRGRHILLR
jgi:hypothetical protein